MKMCAEEWMNEYSNRREILHSYWKSDQLPGAYFDFIPENVNYRV